MERYTLEELYTLTSFKDAISSGINSDMLMGILPVDLQLGKVKTFIANVVYGYFYNDLVAYKGEDEDDVRATFIKRFCYDVSARLPYWYRKYNEVQKLLTSGVLSMMQTSKMTSSSSDKTKTASGTLQKTATTPTGVSATTAEDSFDISISESSGSVSADVETTGFADKYTNAQQKFANATEGLGERSGEILREGSIDELINVLEKLPSSFADEISRHLQKHFIFDYDGEMKGLYDETI